MSRGRDSTKTFPRKASQSIWPGTAKTYSDSNVKSLPAKGHLGGSVS